MHVIMSFLKLYAGGAIRAMGIILNTLFLVNILVVNNYSSSS